jgi:hypothetical protein
MGQTKAIAMVALAAATPEDDTPAGLFEAGHVRVPGGGAIDTRTASARKIERVAKRIRDAHDAGKPRRGRTTTAEERLYASKLEAALRKAGLDHATAEVVATRPGQPSELRLAHVPLDAVATLARVLARSRRS